LIHAVASSRIVRSASVWALYVVGFVPAVWYFYLGATGQIPGNAVKVFEHLLGIWALRFLIATLAVTPLRDLAGINLIRYRRALGLLAFWYVLMHFATYMILDQALNGSAIVKDIAERPFITIGMASLAMLIPLAFTSNAFSIRRLGARWQRLHKLVYLIAFGGALHYVMSVKVVTAQPFIYMSLVLLLLAYRPFRRTIMRWRKERRSGLPERQAQVR
jgi:sulfoxide reductase heme-binding subunit YedZ